MVFSAIIVLLCWLWFLVGSANRDVEIRECVEQRATFAKTASDSVTAYKACLQPRNQ